MSDPLRDLQKLLRSLQPELHEGLYCFCLLPRTLPLQAVPAVAAIWETEGLTVVLTESAADHFDLDSLFTAAWITLTVHSDLAAVGLTAAVSTALAAAGVSCNVIAAVHHDHLFVPPDRAADAMRILTELSAHAAQPDVS